MTDNNDKEKSVVYLGSTQIEETIQMIEKEDWNAGEILYDDLKDICRAVGNGRDTKSHYEYVRDLLTYLINKDDYWQEQ